MKVKRLIITNAYKSMDMSIFRVGDVLDFDCYVKRLNGFVVIISSGTVLTQKELTLISRFDKHFIKYSDYKKVSFEKFITRDKEEQLYFSCEEIKDSKLETLQDWDQKAQIVYNSLVRHVKRYFKNHESICMECIDYCTLFYISALDKDPLIFKRVLNGMRHSNRHEIHSTNVMVLSVCLANYLGFSLVQIKKLAQAAILHDFGKSDVPEHIFEKKSPLSDAEYQEVKKHSYNSYKAVQKLGIDNSDILNAILHHHEYLDGSGYPGGLKGNKISLLTQIITLCDMFDAMTSERNFREKISALETLKIMKIEYKKRLNVRYINDFIKLISKAYST